MVVRLLMDRGLVLLAEFKTGSHEQTKYWKSVEVTESDTALQKYSLPVGTYSQYTPSAFIAFLARSHH